MDEDTISIISDESMKSKSLIAEGAPTKTNDVLSWSLDPKKSFSDWTIEIVPIDVPKKDTWSLLSDDNRSIVSEDTLRGQDELYHVNRVILAFGEHKSEYFAELFSKHKPDDQRFTRIELSPFVAKYFPQFLDFFYGNFSAQDLTIDNVLALHDLADRFEVSKLYRFTDEYIRASLQSLENCIKLVNELDRLNDEHLAQSVVDACARKYSEDSRQQYISLSPVLFTKVLTSSALKCEGGELSVALVSHIKMYNEARQHLFMDSGVYSQQLTCCEKMPVVAFEPALYFLREQFVPSDASDGKCHCGIGKSLYLRCIESIAKRWDRLDDDCVQSEIEQLPLKTQLDVRTAALKEGVTKMSECRTTLTTKISDLKKEQNELSASIKQDIDDSRVLKSLGVAWVDPGTIANTEVEEIRVCGAAIKGTNGVYVYTGATYIGYRKFQKGALINGKKKIFEIVANKVAGNKKEWRWWIRSGTEWYYWAEFTPGRNGKAPIPPGNIHWKTTSFGKKPNPFVTILLHSTA